MTIPIPTIDELTGAWQAAKLSENEAKQARLELERQLLSHPDINAGLKDEGTATFGRLKIATGFYRHWDQLKLANAQRLVTADYWPFKSKFDEIRDGSRFLEANHADLWEAISPALTLKPKKPSFSVKGG